VQSRIYRKGIREDPERLVYECGFCGLVYLENRIADLKEYYRSVYRKTHDSIPGQQLTAEQRFHIQYDLARPSVRKFTSEVPPGSSVLEIGCSAGGFLGHLVQKGYDCFGSEWNPEDAAFVREVGEIPCEEGDLGDIYPGKKFTAIVAIATIEHIADPMAFLRACRERLIGGGWLYLETPNLQDALLSMYGCKAYADFWFREPHITYWKAETLGAVVAATGFEARVFWYPRYGLHNHVNWLLNGKPMQDVKQARGRLSPVPKTNPGAGALNRIWDQLDEEYRVQMETLAVADTLTCMARRREI